VNPNVLNVLDENEGVVYAAEYSIPPNTKENLNNLNPDFSAHISGLKVGFTTLTNPRDRFPVFAWGSGFNRVKYSCVCTSTPHLNEKKVHKMLTVEYPNAHIQGEWWKENSQMKSDLNTVTFPSIDQGIVQGVVESCEYTRFGQVKDFNRERISRWHSSGRFSDSLMNARSEDSSLSFHDTDLDGEEDDAESKNSEQMEGEDELESEDEGDEAESEISEQMDDTEGETSETN
jgi:hypothetical protein